jgi:hypothetical protein
MEQRGNAMHRALCAMLNIKTAKPSASTNVYHPWGSRGLKTKPFRIQLCYRALTFTISFPCASTMCTAQARQGSKE